MDHASQGQVAPGAGQVLEGAGGAGFIDLQPALAHGRHLAVHGNEALLVHPLEQLQRLEAVAHGVLPQPFWLIGTEVAGGDAAPQILGLVGQLAVGLDFDYLRQQRSIDGLDSQCLFAKEASTLKVPLSPTKLCFISKPAGAISLHFVLSCWPE
jgi:hypothetical protein